MHLGWWFNEWTGWPSQPEDGHDTNIAGNHLDENSGAVFHDDNSNEEHNSVWHQNSENELNHDGDEHYEHYSESGHQMDWNKYNYSGEGYHERDTNWGQNT